MFHRRPLLEDDAIGGYAMKTRPLMERLLEKVEIDPYTSCWVWTASTGPNGYGQINSGRLSTPENTRIRPNGARDCKACDVRVSKSDRRRAS